MNDWPEMSHSSWSSVPRYHLPSPFVWCFDMDRQKPRQALEAFLVLLSLLYLGT